MDRIDAPSIYRSIIREYHNGEKTIKTRGEEKENYRCRRSKSPRTSVWTIFQILDFPWFRRQLSFGASQRYQISSSLRREAGREAWPMFCREAGGREAHVPRANCLVTNDSASSYRSSDPDPSKQHSPETGALGEPKIHGTDFVGVRGLREQAPKAAHPALEITVHASGAEEYLGLEWVAHRARESRGCCERWPRRWR